MRPLRAGFALWKERLDVYQARHFDIESSEQPQALLGRVQEALGEHSLTAVWAHLGRDALDLATPLVKGSGFEIHKGEGASLSLCRWLRPGPSRIVPYSRWYIAAGAIVIRDNAMLMVEEKGGARRGQFGIPGGRAEPNESIGACAERELREETAIHAKFVRVLMMRELEKYMYDGYDVYMACLMRQQDAEQEVTQCPEEVLSHQWVPLEQLEQFVLHRCRGTQQFVGRLVARMHSQGCDFQAIPSSTTSLDYRISEHTPPKRMVVHHFPSGQPS